MDEIKVYGNYYRMRKRFGNTPQEITVLEIDGEDVVFCWGHYSQEFLEEKQYDGSMKKDEMLKNRMKKDKIIIKISEKQRQRLDEQNRKLEELILEGERMKEEFISGSCDW